MWRFARSPRPAAARRRSAKERFYVAWIHGGETIGHSSISHIGFGRSAHVHMHVWRAPLRRAGLGAELLSRSIDLCFARFSLERILCEPYADNPGPNRVARKLGFRRLIRYRTVLSDIALEQEVNRYLLERAAWAARRGDPHDNGSGDGYPRVR